MFTFGGFPFGDMQDGGFAPRGPRREVDTNKFYELLQLDKSASQADIKKSYRKLAIKHHPDKGGDPEVFKEISRAYEVLGDPEKKKIYDEFGEEGLEGQTAADPTDIFQLFFGGGRSKGPQGKRRGEDRESTIKVTLEQIYNGAMRKMALTRDIICSGCDGQGGPPEAIEKCQTCGGTGIRVQVRQIGPMIQQTQGPCHSCRGGKVIQENLKCRKCNGVGTCKDRKVLEVYIPKGAPDGHKIVFSGEADQRPDTIPGDVRFILDQQEHEVFKRRGPHLFVTKEITLFEALTGFSCTITHLDDRKLAIKKKPSETISSGSVKVIRNEGMPIYKHSMEKGNLFVEFNVKMPKPHELLLEGNALKSHLKKVLPTPSTPMIKDDDAEYEIHYAESVSESDYNVDQGGRGEAYEEDDYDHSGGQRVQCRQH